MSELFTFSRTAVVTPLLAAPQAAAEHITFRGWAEALSPRAAAAPLDVRGAPGLDARQFYVFQLSSVANGPALLDPTAVEPAIAGSPDEPDVRMRLELLSFHVGAAEGIDPNTRATLRINIGKDESSPDKRFDLAFWSIAAGLSLYDQATGARAESKKLGADLPRAFGNRPIEIPGGLGKLSFEVVKHKDPTWWQRIFGFLQSKTGERLVSVLGFPAITIQAIDLLDELLNKVAEAEPTPLFKSLPMRLAFSRYARDEFTGGNPRVKAGCLRPGLCVLARTCDYARFADADLGYHMTLGRLGPTGASPQDLLTGPDPLADVTYAVFRVGMKAAQLDPTFQYS